MAFSKTFQDLLASYDERVIKIKCEGKDKVFIDEFKELQGKLKNIDETNLEKLLISILKYGFANPMFAWKDNKNKIWIHDGHQRNYALKFLRDNYDFIIPALPTSYIIADNKRDAKEKLLVLDSRYAKITNEGLNEFLNEEGCEINFDDIEPVIELPDFDMSGFNDEYGNVPPEATEDDYEMPEEIETDVKRGDIITFSKNGEELHRLMCGDSTNADDVAKLMNGEKADMVVSDPPYNTGMKKQIDEKARLSHMFNDSFTDDDWKDLIQGFYSNYDLFTKGECVIYIFIDWRRVNDLRVGLEQIADVKNIIVWDKGVHGLGSDYKSTYELCIVGKKGKPDIQNRFGLDYQDIWRVQRSMGRNKDHATQKPIELIVKPIKHASKEDDIVLDLFLGSGTTMVAAHQLKRKCYGMELDEKYCQVIIDRMQKLDEELLINYH